MSAMDAWVLVAVLVLAVVAGLLYAAEVAISHVSLPRAKKLVDQRRRGATALTEFVRALPQSIATLALLRTIARVALTVLLAVEGWRLLGGGAGFVTGAAVAVLLVYVGTDVVPRRVSEFRPNRVAAPLAGALRPLVRVLAPVAGALVRIGSAVTPGDGERAPVVTEDYLRDLIDAAESDDVLEPSKRAMIESIFELDDTVVREIMVPRPDMVTVPLSASIDAVVDVVLHAGHSRVPVHGDDLDVIEGVIYAKDLLRLLHSETVGDTSWTKYMRPPHVVPELKSVDELLRELQTQKVHLAVVVDEYGSTVGLVTIEDILEEIVGEIVDEYDREVDLVEQLEPDRWRVDARLPIDDLAELVDARLPDEEWDTVGGLLFGMLGHVAAPGECVAVDGISLTAEQVSGRRIATVLVERGSDEDES